MDSGVDPADLEVCLRVLGEVQALPVEHPDAVAVRRATGSLYKTVKEQRRAQRRAAVLAADAAVTAATATGAHGRIDDETAGLPLRAGVDGGQRRDARAGARVLRLQAPLRRGRRASITSSVRTARPATARAATPAPTCAGGARC